MFEGEPFQDGKSIGISVFFFTAFSFGGISEVALLSLQVANCNLRSAFMASLLLVIIGISLSTHGIIPNVMIETEHEGR